MSRRIGRVGALVVLIMLGGCFAVARKGIGTIMGPRGKAEIVSMPGQVEPGEGVKAVLVENHIGERLSPEDASLLRDRTMGALAGADLLGGGTADLTLTLEVNRFTDRPGKKVLEMKATLRRGDATVAIADLDADINGFADHEAVADAVGKAAVTLMEKASSPK